MAKIKITDNKKYWQRYRATGNHKLVGGMGNSTTTLKNSLLVSLKGRHMPTILYDPAFQRESIFAYRDFYTKVHSYFISNSQSPNHPKLKMNAHRRLMH